MTYGVPYSFVPGTKAKADEVNANFIDILEKIADSNTRIDTKANSSDIDGHWVYASERIASSVSLTGTTALDISLAEYLPNDGSIYDVILSGIGSSSNTASQYNHCYITTDMITDAVCLFRNLTNVRNISNCAGGCSVLPVGTDRKISLVRNSEYYGTVSLYVRGYRKVR